MPDTFAQLTAERQRLHGLRLECLIDVATLSLRTKDSRLPGQNQALSAHGYTPGSWHSYFVSTSQSTFVAKQIGEDLGQNSQPAGVHMKRIDMHELAERVTALEETLKRGGQS